MKTKFLSVFILLVMLIMDSCHYEEGPFLSLHSAKKLIAGNWKVESLTADGADSMSYIYRNHFQGIWVFQPDNGPSYPEFSVSVGGYYGEWGATNKEIYLLFKSFNNMNLASDCVLHNTWRIIKLRKHIWKLRATKKGITYEVEFVQL